LLIVKCIIFLPWHLPPQKNSVYATDRTCVNTLVKKTWSFEAQSFCALDLFLSFRVLRQSWKQDFDVSYIISYFFLIYIYFAMTKSLESLSKLNVDKYVISIYTYNKIKIILPAYISILQIICIISCEPLVNIINRYIILTCLVNWFGSFDCMLIS
jgi:hypothetical protein